MPGPTQKLEVSFIDKSLAMRMSIPGKVVGAWEYHPVCNLVSLTGQDFLDFGLLDPVTNQRAHRYPHKDMTRIVIETNGTHQLDLDFDLNDVINQPTWTATPAGVETAKADINAWIAQCADASAGAPLPAGISTEAKQDAMIAELMKMIDFEISCVIDSVTGVVYLMNVEKNETTGVITVTYIDAQGNVVVPPTPANLLVCDASAAMALQLAELVALNTVDFATQTTLAALLTAFNNEGFATETTLALLAAEDFATEVTLAGIKTQTDLLNFIATALEVNVTSSVLPTGAATNTALVNLLTELQLKADLTETQPVSLPTGVQALTNNTVIANGVVAAGAVKAYFQNIGSTNATVNGGPLEPGISIPFEASEGKTLPAIIYVASATAILKIVTVV